MKKSIVFTAVATAAIVGLAGCAADRKDHRERGDHRGGAHKEFRGEGRGMERGGLPRSFERLNLSEEQKKQIQAIMEANRPQQAAGNSRGEDFQQQRAAEQALVSGASFNEAQARQLIAERHQRHAEQELKMLKMRHDIYQVLTPEQRKQLEQTRGQRGDRGQKPRGPQGRMPQPAQ